MKKFQIFRYLQKWKTLVLIIAIVGSVGVYFYGSRRQSYTASAVMSYIGSSAESGVNPDGTAIDTSEITSAAVITDVISDLKLNTNIERIRSNCVITEIIPQDEIDKKAAAIDKVQEYEYFPTKYLITYTVGNRYSKDYARDVLDALLNNYFAVYCEKHVNTGVFPNNATNINLENYDYIECVQLLENSADEIIYYLNSRASSYPDFRSAVTGQSFADLRDSYKNIMDNTLVGLHAFVLNNKLVKNKELLLKKYENNKARYEIQIENSRTHIDEAKAIIDKFGNKTLEENNINYSFGSGTGSNQGLIVNNVEDVHEEHLGNVETTYDRLINQYVKLQVGKIDSEVSLEKCQEVLDTYADAASSTDPNSKSAQRAKETIEEVSAQLNELYAVVLPTLDEFNKKNGADNLAMRSSIVVRENINLNVYLALAILFFLLVGCFFAIFCGRMEDFVDYFMYTDAKTGLPNRSRCDMVIEQYEEKPLPDRFTCMVFKVDIMPNDLPGFSRKDGDVILSKFGNFLKHTMENMAFVGYNNNGMFVSFAEHCSAERAGVLIDQVESLVGNYNENDAPYPIRFTYGMAEAEMDGIYSARELLRESLRRLPPNQK